LARKADTTRKLLVPVSWGELIDKITILEIKVERIGKRDALANVRRELDALNAVVGENAPRRAGVARLKSALRKINLALWEIEDEIRLKERAGTFDAGFVELARAVYRTNDRRARVKREINDLLGSELVEEKHYARY
jgi:cob(I)alamin adenosyltransferase